MKYALEPLPDCWEEVRELAQRCMDEKGLLYIPDYGRYLALFEAKTLFVITIRDEKALIGFAMMYVFQSMHDQHWAGQEDLFYLLPEYRKGWAALVLLREVEKECARRGCTEILMTAELGSAAGDILLGRGYGITSRNYRKTLKRADSPVSNHGKAVA